MNIVVRGAKQNTLKNLNLTLPLGKIIALVGPSGSGKSTLAYETLFAESRRRFLDCLSTGARRLLARPDKPQVDSIEGLPPALCLEQQVPTGQSRSILGSITETLDYLRIIYAAIGTPHDPITGEALRKLSSGEISQQLAQLPEGTRLTLLAPLPAEFARWDETRESDIMDLQKLGYIRVRLRGDIHDLEELMTQPPAEGESCELVIDRIICKASAESRIADSVEAALRVTGDELRALVQAPGEEAELQHYYTRYRNEETGFTLPDLSPQSFSHYSSHGACPECKGLGIIKKENPKKGEDSYLLCPSCHGMRLNKTSLAVTLGFGTEAYSLGTLCTLSIDSLLELLPQLSYPAGMEEILATACDDLSKRLRCLADLGLGYLSLNRATNTLSGGELQRARLASQIGGGLSGVLYILDEPTIGLHPDECERLIRALHQLKEKGNSILLVEHDPQVLASADLLIEMGPGSGPLGGEIIARGSYEELCANPDSPTGAWLSGRKKTTLPSKPTTLDSHLWVSLRDAHARTLQHIDFHFPLAAFTCISGHSGSGKSTLIHECLIPAIAQEKLESTVEKLRPHLARAVLVDQSPLSGAKGKNSMPASATGLLDILRKLFASLPLSKQRGYKENRFSLNIRGGRCERCGGTGHIDIDMSFLADLHSTCDACQGARYNRETLEVSWRGRNMAQLLAMTVSEAADFLRHIPQANGILQAMLDLGLGYLALDRASSSLSGGEAQRIKLASYLARASGTHSKQLRTGQNEEKLLFILDEPSTGLHFNEVELLLKALLRLRDRGHSILCIEHNQSILNSADYLVEMGPGSGAAGGLIRDARSKQQFSQSNKTPTRKSRTPRAKRK